MIVESWYKSTYHTASKLQPVSYKAYILVKRGVLALINNFANSEKYCILLHLSRFYNY